MVERRSYSERIGAIAGLACLGASLLLMPLGVRAARADDEPKAPMTMAPSEAPESQRAPETARRSTPPSTAPPASPAPAPEAMEKPVAEPEPESPRSTVEAESGLIPLNTQGYNYRPEPEAR